jgi:predicted nucleic acid-binding protein
MEHHNRAASTVERLSRIYWDAMVFIYLIEDHPKFGASVGRIYERMRKRQDTLYTSVFTLGEALIGPVKARDAILANKMRTAFRGDDVSLLPFLPSTAEMYANIRVSLPVKSPDAIHLATAAEANVDIFLTNDKHLHRLTIPGIQFIAGLDGVVF